jgi:hypothetical protein
LRHRPHAPLLLVLLASFVPLAPLALLGLAGCEGAIGEPEGTLGAPSGPQGPDPGRVTLHRLNRAEYNNTVRDLLGTSLRPADDFPADDHSYGFDNIADALTISPTQLELYARAAESLAHDVLAQPTASESHLYEAEDLVGTAGAASGSAWNLSSNGEVPVQVDLPVDATYRISALVWQDQAGTEPARSSINAGGISLGQWDVNATAASPELVQVESFLDAGSKLLSVEFLNDYYDPTAGADRNLYVDWIRLEGPLDVPLDNPLRDGLLVCDPAAEGEACVREILTTFASRAWRRPVDDAEVTPLVELVKLAESQGDTTDVGLEVAVGATLLSPHFLFRVELDPDPASATPHLLSGYELASRLSYFLWSSMPDEALFAAAASGELDTAEGVRKQVMRMFVDPKADALIDNFAGQWLYTRALGDHTPDYMAFPAWDDDLRDALEGEARSVFSELLHSERPAVDVLTTDFTYLNDRLATHYGLPLPGSDQLVRVDLPADSLRGGLLTQGSLLTVTSYPRRTSPVKRGKWVLSQLLCSEPDPPPPGVEALDEEAVTAGTLREILAAHRADPVCASCHDTMDGIGLALENYDGTGAFRAEENGAPIDASGSFPTGETFVGAKQLATLLREDPRLFACTAKKLMTYALGRSPGPDDAAYLADVTQAALADGGSFSRLLVEIAASDPFRYRRGEPSSEGGAK